MYTTPEDIAAPGIRCSPAQADPVFREARAGGEKGKGDAAKPCAQLMYLSHCVKEKPNLSAFLIGSTVLNSFQGDGAVFYLLFCFALLLPAAPTLTPASSA